MWSWWKQGSAGCVSHPPIRSPLWWAKPPGGREIGSLAGNLHHPTVFFFGYHWYHASENLHPTKIEATTSRSSWSIYKFTTLDFRKKKKDIPTEIPVPTFGPFGLLRETYLPRSYTPLRNKGWIIGLPSSLYTIRPYQPLFFGETFHALFTVRRLKSSPATPTHEPSRVVRKGFFWNPATFPY